jgi:ATP phosphoribosyltransferase regulatory subunit
MKSHLTPFGVSDYTPNQTQEIRDILTCASTVFDHRLYKRIKTPTIEYFDSLERGLGDNLKKKTIKFFDKNGDVLILRPDNTTPIARLVATHMKEDPLPLKLCYMDPIFIQSSSSLDGGIERFQVGVEYIGEESLSADVDVIETCMDVLDKMGTIDYGIDIGHIELLHGLSDEKRHALLSNDYLSFGAIPKRGDDSIVYSSSILSSLSKRLKKHPSASRITYNTGLVKNLYYYTGVIFEVFDKNSKKVIASGGRYDNLLGKFGYPQPAVGFAIKVDAIRKKKR